MAGHVSGEVRSGLTPNKPQRTASIRDAIADTPKRMTTSTAQSEDSGYESVELTSGKTTLRTNQVILRQINRLIDLLSYYVANKGFFIIIIISILDKRNLID